MKLLDQINNLNLSPQANKTLIEFFIERYKGVREEREEIIEQNKKKIEEIKNIDFRLENVESLIKTKERIGKEITKFGNLAEENERKVQVHSIKVLRLKYVFETLKNVKIMVYRKFTEALESNDRNFLVGRSVILSIFLIFVISIVYYFIKQDSRLLAIGFIGLSLNLFALILMNIFNNVEISEIDGLGINYSLDNTNTYEELIEKLDRNQELFLVNSAWITALEKEKLNVTEAINSKLDGTTHDYMIQKKAVLKNEIEANELALSKSTETIISAEDYLSLRRELDILSIELEGEEVDENKILEELKGLHVKDVTSTNGSFRKLLTLAQAKYHFSVS